MQPLWQTWKNFWFMPSDANLIRTIRFLIGLALIYTHAIWTVDFTSFMGKDAWVLSRNQWLNDLTSNSPSSVLWAFYLGTLLVFALFCLGFRTGITAPLAWLLHMLFSRYMVDAVFGLDQMLSMLLFCLLFAPWHKGVSPWTTLSLRLIQCHLCINYFFNGLGKVADASWIDGSALATILSIPEYQTFDNLWLLQWPQMLKYAGYMVVFLELSYPFLVWNKMLRPYVVLMAIAMHLGIGIFMGMGSFAFVMIVANLAFLNLRFSWCQMPCLLEANASAENTAKS